MPFDTQETGLKLAWVAERPQSGLLSLPHIDDVSFSVARHVLARSDPAASEKEAAYGKAANRHRNVKSCFLPKEGLVLPFVRTQGLSQKCAGEGRYELPIGNPVRQY